MKLVLVLLIFSTKTIIAQIIYTDIIPDTTITAPDDAWASFDIDLNNDSTVDFVLNHHNMVISQNYQKIEMTALDFNEILCDSANFPLAINQGQPISSLQLHWYYPNGWMIHLNENGIAGHWIGVNDKYIGVRIGIGGQWHYGWIRLDIPVNASYYTVKDFAYNATHSQGITAGDMGNATVEDRILDACNILITYPNYGLLQVTINSRFESDATLLIYSMNGTQVFSTIIYAGERKTVLDISQIPNGIYVIQFWDHQNFFTQKFIKIH